MRRIRALSAAAAGLAVTAAVAVWAAWPDAPAYTTENAVVTVRSGPGGDEPVDLDTTLYLPTDRGGPVPAVLLAHGFGGTKESVAADAKDLAGLGYAVLAYTARGFGRSGGEVHLDSPDYEVRDAQRLLDWLAARPEVRKDADGDPRVGVVGGSYGGGLALLLAAQDQRVDAIVPMITWNDLARSFLPESTGRTPVEGVFKKGWAGLFFGNTAGDMAGGAGDPTCGRFARDVCEMYQQVATTGRATQSAVDLLRRSSPAPVLDRIKAPALLIQGEADTLFPLSEADANARGIAAGGTPVRVAWFTGGHDGGDGPQTDRDRVRYLTAQWLDHYVKGAGDAPSNSFTWSRVAGFDAMDRGLVTNGFSVDTYPGLTGTALSQVALTGPTQPIANPPGGNPAAISALPGAGALGSVLPVTDLPGQHAMFDSAPLADAVDIVGAPTVSIRAASPTGEAVLFVKLYDLDENGTGTLPSGLIAPVRLTGLPTDIAQAQPVTVTLPAIVRRIEAGHRLRVSIATSDQGYATPAEPTVYTVGLAGGGVTVPTVTGEPIATTAVLWRWVLVALIAAVALGLAVVVLIARRRHRRTDTSVLPEYAQTPLVVKQLRKEYADGFVAVSKVDFTVERGQVVGLLGPNGAGKTTTLRVLMGLTQPSGGEIFVFGHRLVPGAPVLSRLGALVEGPGFLPHLSGLENLKAYWGRPGARRRTPASTRPSRSPGWATRSTARSASTATA
ncbi:hypothetical protein Prum_046070 [Phytohabitans rumicis]|uniref:Xaa-Pro dipeptidyl-peptidase C-terminal domain-containing protein n=1 Tax=Phytohabitans rumicis TaxID=1076125 RepID=A0A6V8LE78_9ACTN|nr:hypothetical protein Prum_046070 [Phytohabitans rumicis]